MGISTWPVLGVSSEAGRSITRPPSGKDILDPAFLGISGQSEKHVKVVWGSGLEESRCDDSSVQDGAPSVVDSWDELRVSRMLPRKERTTMGTLIAWIPTAGRGGYSVDMK